MEATVAQYRFEGAAAVERVKQRVLRHAIGAGEDRKPPDPPPPTLNEILRDFVFYCFPLLLFVVKICFLLLTLLILSVATCAMIWRHAMGGLEVKSRPIFFDYATPGLEGSP